MSALLERKRTRPRRCSRDVSLGEQSRPLLLLLVSYRTLADHVHFSRTFSETPELRPVKRARSPLVAFVPADLAILEAAPTFGGQAAAPTSEDRHGSVGQLPSTVRRRRTTAAALRKEAVARRQPLSNRERDPQRHDVPQFAHRKCDRRRKMPLQEISSYVLRGPRTSDVPIKKPQFTHARAHKQQPVNSKPKKAPRRKKLSAKWFFDAKHAEQSDGPLRGWCPCRSTRRGCGGRVRAVEEDGQDRAEPVLECGIESRQARLDVLAIMANCALTTDPVRKAAVQDALMDVTEWFDEYMAEEGNETDTNTEETPEPELHKAMLVLLQGAFDYKLKTEDLLELCRGHRKSALETVTGLLRTARRLATGVAQKNAASEHERAVWEKVVVSQKVGAVADCPDLVGCRGFTHPSTYFKALDEGFYFLECGVDLPEHSVEQFTVEMQGLLAVTMNQRLVEKLSYALHDALFEGRCAYSRTRSTRHHCGAYVPPKFVSVWRFDDGHGRIVPNSSHL